MTTISRKGPIIDPGLCRCCGSTKKCRLLNVEYECLGQKEIYSDMFVDCFGLLLSYLDGEPEDRLICATCVSRLREAAAFRRQVLHCEEKLLLTKIHVHDDNEDRKVKMEVQVKQEDSEGNDSDDHHDDVTPMDDATDIGVKSECNNSAVHEDKLNMDSEKQAKSNNIKDVKAKKEMLLKMRIMKEKLNKMQQIDQPLRTKLKSIRKSEPSTDKEYNALRNAITIVENSYVCPFLSVFSDYFCVYCKEMFTEHEGLRAHTLTHDPSTYKDVVTTKKTLQIDIERIDCRLCPKKIDNIDIFKHHITSVHNKLLYTEVDNEFLKFKLKLGSVKCIECGQTFSNFHSLKKHMAEHFGTYICDMCGAHYFEESKLLLHRKTHKSNEEIQQEFHCDECGKSFKSKHSRYFHIARIHKNEPAYPCNKCDEVFLSYSLRYRHKIEFHGEKRSFPCDSCDKVYDNRKTLRDHNRKNHLLVLKHECTYCDKKFYLPSALKDHMTSHTGERNFRCEYCGKSYPRLRALRVHMQSHNSEKKYKCSLCTASYTQVNNYKNHMKSKHQMGLNGGTI